MRVSAYVAAALLVIVGAAAYYWYASYWVASDRIEPKPVPSAVTEAEEALGLPETAGFLHVNVEHAVEVERALLGREDTETRLEPIAESDAIVGVLLRGGMDLRESLDHVLAAIVPSEDGIDLVGIAIGEFPVQRITELLPEAYRVERSTIAGAPVFLLTREDPETCTVSDPVAVHLAERRIVAGDPDLVGAVLERLTARSPSAVDLAAWRAYRDGKIASLGLLAAPRGLTEATNNPLALMAAKAAEDELMAIERVFAGTAVTMHPPGLTVDARIESSEPAWAGDTVRAYKKWKADLDEDIGRELPTLVRLVEHLEIEADGSRLTVRTSLSKDLLNDAVKLPVELLTLVFADMGMRSTMDATQPSAEEQIIPAEEIGLYRANLSSTDLKPFDPTLDKSFTPDAETGPFGIRVTALRLSEGEDGPVEIELEAVSGELPNMDVDSTHAVKGEPRAELFVTHVRGHDGRELLREERCGPKRNSLGGELQPTTRNFFIDNEFVPVRAVRGAKAVRLESGAGIKDIAAIEGHLRLRLPTRIETQRIAAPFAGQVVETPEVRVRFSAGAPGAIKYEISGRTDHVLAVRALNASEQYLRGAGSYSVGPILGVGKSVGRSFQGEPAFAELVVAREETVETYPFALSPVAPRFDRWDHPKPYAVATTSKDEFVRRSERVDLSGVCEKRAPDRQLAPFQLCPRSVKTVWRSMRGQFQVFAPDLPELMGNLSALELRVEELTVKGEDGAEDERVAFAMQGYVRLGSAYGKDYLRDTPWLVAELPEELKNKTIVGVRGRLVARLPKDLDRLSLDVTELGNRAAHPGGLGARLVEFSDGQLKLDITGPRERLIQFIPRDAEDNILATNAARLEATDESGRWRGVVAISGRPATLDIVFAEVQDRLEYAFDMTVGE